MPLSQPREMEYVSEEYQAQQEAYCPNQTIEYV